MEENEKKSSDVELTEVKDNKHLNFIFKIVSVLCALIVWLYVAETNDKGIKKDIYSVPVSIFTAEDLSVIQGSGATVDVTVSGSKSAVNSVSADNITAYVDLSDIDSAGRYTRNIDVALSGAEGVSIIAKTPDNLSVYLDKTTSVTVPVKVQLYGYMLSDGYEMGEPICNISEVTVSGPEAELLGISYAGAFVEFDGNTYVTGNINVSSEIKLIDASGNAIDASYVSIKGEKYVNISVPVYLTKKVPLYADCKYGYYNSDNSEITINPEYVTVRGLAENVTSLERIKLMTIDEKKINSDTYASSAINLPDGITSTDGISSASVTIKHKGTSTKTVITSNYNIIAPAGIKAEVTNEYIGILIRGKRDILEKITASDVTLNVDLSSISVGTGTVQVPVTVVISPEYSENTYELGEYTVSVELAE